MKTLAKLSIFVLLALWAGGCSTGEGEAPLANQAHPPGWRTGHHDSAADLLSCQVCHGVDLNGPGQVPGCFDCHASGPPFVVHPDPSDAALPWSDPVNHGFAAKADMASCQGCHSRPGGIAGSPRYDFPLGELEAGCESSGCHSPNTAHPTSAAPDAQFWFGPDVSHSDVRNFVGCIACHGEGGSGGSGPACATCHSLDPIAFPSNCVSCHGMPPVGQPGTGIANLDSATFLAEYHFPHQAIILNDPAALSCNLCHGANSGHPTNYRQLHAADANLSLASCQSCHGQDLQGVGIAVSCFNCHSGEPPFQLHPRVFRAPEDHGPAAKADILSCQGCHGEEGEVGSNPRFNVPIGSLEAGCESSGCHNPTTAHPTPAPPDSQYWFGPDFTHSGIGSSVGCTLCHGINGEGTDASGSPSVAPACTLCHSINPVDIPSCHSCHGDVPVTDPVKPIANIDPDVFKSQFHRLHVEILANDPAGETCFICHGGAAGHPAGFLTTHGAEALADIASCQLCHGADLNGIGAAVSCLSCHSGNFPFELHPRDYRDPEDHGPAARASIKSCQGCHGQPGGAGSNPRFDVPIGSLEAGCESSGCHSVNTAHPTPSAPDATNWYGTTVSHYQVGDVQTSCTLCHGVFLEGGVGPACTDCHELPPTVYPTGCASCHGGPLAGESEVRGAVLPIPNVPDGHLGHSAVTSGPCWSCH